MEPDDPCPGTSCYGVKMIGPCLPIALLNCDPVTCVSDGDYKCPLNRQFPLLSLLGSQCRAIAFGHC